MKTLSEFTVPELKKILKEHNLNSSGTKAELINRLMTADPSGEWMNDVIDEAELAENQSAPQSQDNANGGPDEFAGSGTSTQNLCTDAVLRREMELCRREKELAERELAMARREIEYMRQASAASTNAQPERPGAEHQTSTNIGITAIAELLGPFNGDSETWDRWEKQIRLLRATYNLNDNLTRVLIGLCLKGRACDWLQSKAEHLLVTVDDLLEELKSMFSRRTSIVTARRRFEERLWQRGEPFGDYLHDKLILANRASIGEAEALEYAVEGIPDSLLRNQARIQGLGTAASLLRAFERVQLPARTPLGGEASRERSSATSAVAVSGSRFDDRKCFNCGRSGHVSARCMHKNRGLKCFNCNGFGHVAANCRRNTNAPRRTDAPPGQTNIDVAVIDEARPLRGKCFKDVEFEGHSVIALIDTGSDLSLMKASKYVELGAPKLHSSGISFRGFGSSNNRTLGEFRGALLADGETYQLSVHVIPDQVMTQDFLIGANFINTVEVNIREGRATIVKPAGYIAELANLCNGELCEANQLDVGSGVSAEIKRIISERVQAYNPIRTCEAPTEMRIIMKDDEPVYQRPRRLVPAEREIVNKQIRECLREEIIQPSVSEYASPVVLLEIKDRTNRLCVDVLSRNPLPSCLVVSEDDDGLIQRLRVAQRQDPELCKFSDIAENGTSEDFTAKAGLIYKVVADGDVRLVVPKAMQNQIIRKAHESGLFVASKTEALLRRDYWLRRTHARMKDRPEVMRMIDKEIALMFDLDNDE